MRSSPSPSYVVCSHCKRGGRDRPAAGAGRGAHTPAYVRTQYWRHGLGSRLLRYLLTLTRLPCLVGTWDAATWALSFYGKHGFRRVGEAEKDRLLPMYWGVPERQIETSVVLAKNRWFEGKAIM